MDRNLLKKCLKKYSDIDFILRKWIKAFEVFCESLVKPTGLFAFGVLLLSLIFQYDGDAFVAESIFNDLFIFGFFGLFITLASIAWLGLILGRYVLILFDLAIKNEKDGIGFIIKLLLAVVLTGYLIYVVVKVINSFAVVFILL